MNHKNVSLDETALVVGSLDVARLEALQKHLQVLTVPWSTCLLSTTPPPQATRYLCL